MFYSASLQAVADRLGLAQDFRSLAVRVQRLSEPLTRSATAAIHLPDELSNVQGVASERKLDWELGRLSAGERQYEGSIAYTVERPLLLDGNFYKGRAKLRVAGRSSWRLRRLPSAPRPGGFLVDSDLGQGYFGDWMAIDLQLLRVAAPHGPLISIREPEALTAHQRQYLARDRLVPPAPLREPCVLESLTTFNWYGITSQQIACWQAMRDRSIAARRTPCVAPGVFLKRGVRGVSRALINEDELAQRLSRLGFLVLEPERLGVDELMASVADAPLVIGVEGSHLAHGFHAMSSRGAMVVIQPPQRFNNPFKDRCDAAGLRYAFTVAHAEGEGFRCDPDHLLRLLDLVQRELARAA